MKLRRIFRSLRPQPVSVKAAEQCLSALACLCSVYLTGLGAKMLLYQHQPLLLASMGASAVILFATPGSPLAQPWPLLGGQLFSALVGILMAEFIADTVDAASLAVGFSVAAMLVLRCLHPPGAATALAPVLGGMRAHSPDTVIFLMTLAINVLLMLGLAIIINRFILRRNYPLILSK